MSPTVNFNGVTLNASRLDTIANAATLDQAQRMGVFDSIKDLFRGGVKKEAIKQAFEALHPPARDDYATPAAHENLLLHYGVLQQALRPEHAGACQLQVAADPATQTWSYRIEVNGQPLASAHDLPVGDGYTLAAFQDHALLTGLAQHLHQQLGADMAPMTTLLAEQFRESNLLHAQAGSLNDPGVMLEKFGAVMQQLGALPGGALVIPGVTVDDGLDRATLSVSGFTLATVEITGKDVLADVLGALANSGVCTANQMLASRDVAQAARGALQDMVDDPHERQALEARIDDPAFSRANFLRVEDHASDAARFNAVFRDPAGGPDVTLTLSNRAATNMELRGERLQHKLADAHYDNLAALIASDFGGQDDTQLVYPMTAIRNDLEPLLDRIAQGAADHLPAQGRPADETAQAYVQALKRDHLAPLGVGQTTVGALWGWQASTPAVPPTPDALPQDSSPSLAQFLDNRA